MTSPQRWSAIMMCRDYSEDSVWTARTDSRARVLPLPTVLDSGAAVLLHLLLEDELERPVLLDAAGLHDIRAVGALLLAAALRARACIGTPPRIINLPYRLRSGLSRHPLLEFVDSGSTSPVFHRIESGAPV